MVALCPIVSPATFSAAQQSAASLTEIHSVEFKATPFCIAKSPSSKVYYFGGAGAIVGQVTSLESKPEVTYFTGDFVHSGEISGLVVAGSGQPISGGVDRGLVWWDPDSEESIVRIDDAHDKPIRHLSLSPDGKVLATAGDDLICRLWDAVEGFPIQELRAHQEEENVASGESAAVKMTCEFNPDGSMTATATSSGHVLVWKLETGELKSSMQIPDGTIASLAFSLDGKVLAAGGEDKGRTTVWLLDWAKAEIISEVKSSVDGPVRVARVRCHPGGKYLFAVGETKGAGVLQVIELNTGKIVLEKLFPKVPLHDLAFGKDGGSLAVAGRNRITYFSVKL